MDLRSRTVADDLHANLVRIFAYLFGLAVLTFVGVELIDTPRRLAAATPPEPQPGWIEIGRPHEAFALAMGEFVEADFRYVIRRHVAAGGRMDILHWEPSGASPSAMVEIYRPGDELARFGNTLAEVTARLRQFALASPPAETEPVDTKFGTVALVDFTVKSPAGPRRCAGFAHGFGEPRLLIAGFACNGGPEIVDRSLVACMLDRLTLMSSGSDPKLGELFARAELKRTFCGHKGQLMAATPRHPDLTTGSVSPPKLRRRVAAR